MLNHSDNDIDNMTLQYVRESNTFLLRNIQGLFGLGAKSKVGFLYDQAWNNKALWVAVTESWLKPAVNDGEFLIDFPGYSIFRCDREIRERGTGVCLFLSNEISGETIASFDNGVCELLVVKLHSLNTIIFVA